MLAVLMTLWLMLPPSCWLCVRRIVVQASSRAGVAGVRCLLQVLQALRRLLVCSTAARPVVRNSTLNSTVVG